eukprot:TRINITY_DN1514_c0_g1_i1.p1 TRINITY_DN1514_c0_g1~~TRINITY_DN1514_c0_g1_i1.p1  ORF type:complete len:290 (-),score=72.44 TRINITY_DN1514_c0_g1_i1:21-845(-)
MYIASLHTYYDGTFENGRLKNGIWCKNKNLYKGPFIAGGSFHGKGIYVFSSGKIKQANFSNGVMDQASAVDVTGFPSWPFQRDFSVATPIQVDVIPSSYQKLFDPIPEPEYPPGFQPGTGGGAGATPTRGAGVSPKESDFRTQSSTPTASPATKAPPPSTAAKPPVSPVAAPPPSSVGRGGPPPSQSGRGGPPPPTAGGSPSGRGGPPPPTAGGSPSVRGGPPPPSPSRGGPPPPSSVGRGWWRCASSRGGGLMWTSSHCWAPSCGGWGGTSSP